MQLDELMNACFREMSEGERCVCRYIAEHGAACADLTIAELADACHVSKSMVVRFAQRLGLSGFAELKARLRIAAPRAVVDEGALLDNLALSYHKMVDELAQRDLTPCLRGLAEARRVYVHGSGAAQGRVASEMARIFLPVKEMIPSQGHDMAAVVRRMAQPGDAVVLISLSGESPAVVDAARSLQARGVWTVSITRMGSNTLASLCAEHLYIQSLRIPFANDQTHETSTLYYILIEFLYLAYLEFCSSEVDALPTRP